MTLARIMSSRAGMVKSVNTVGLKPIGPSPGLADSSSAPRTITQSEATALGLTRVNTGRPCKRGHYGERQVASWTCCVCDRLKYKGEPLPPLPALPERAFDTVAKVWRETMSCADARRAGKTRYFTGMPCSLYGHVTDRIASGGSCCECDRLKKHASNLSPAQLERQRAKDRERYHADPAKAARQWNEWYERNRAAYNASVATYKADKRSATPAWANHDAIDAVFKDAARLQALHGEPYEVDHIVPLRSKRVCGLNVEHNLRPLLRELNQLKNNRHWPGDSDSVLYTLPALHRYAPAPSAGAPWERLRGRGVVWVAVHPDRGL